jgi:hypothetical protein
VYITGDISMRDVVSMDEDDGDFNDPIPRL